MSLQDVLGSDDCRDALTEVGAFLDGTQHHVGKTYIDYLTTQLVQQLWPDGDTQTYTWNSYTLTLRLQAGPGDVRPMEWGGKLNNETTSWDIATRYDYLPGSTPRNDNIELYASSAAHLDTETTSALRALNHDFNEHGSASARFVYLVLNALLRRIQAMQRWIRLDVVSGVDSNRRKARGQHTILQVCALLTDDVDYQILNLMVDEYYQIDSGLGTDEIVAAVKAVK